MRTLFFVLLSFQLLAQDISWVNNTPIIRSYSSPRTTDLNNDGIDDVVMGGGTEEYPTPYGIIALDGNNGIPLWEVETRGEMFTSPQFFDFNNDNIDDILIGGRDAELRLINGNNGDVIWEFWTEETNPNDDGWYNFYTSQIIDDQNNDGTKDILTSNGGDHSLDASEFNRPPGHIMIIDGANGNAIKTAVVPDSNETYLSPIICDLNNDGNKSIIFGSGGETVEGNLWIADLNDLINEDLSNATPLVSNSELGFLAPPAIGDLNSDGIMDIIAQGFDGKITAINGLDLSILWQYEINYSNTESQASPILGKFSNTDSNLDVFATLFSGSESSYNDYYQVLIDGQTGDQIWIDSIGIVNFCTPIAFDSNMDGTDEVMISIMNIDNGYWESELILIDFVNNIQSSLIGPISGGNVSCTPQISDIDNDGLLDIIFSVRADSLNPFSPGGFDSGGINTMKITTEYTLSEDQISWGSYMGTNFDGIYSEGCQGDLGLFAYPSEACPGQNNAMINLYIQNGTPPYIYEWSNGETSEDLENLGPGLYSVTVTDATGACDTISREVTEYNIISFYQEPTCVGGNDGMVYFNSSGCDCNTSFCQFIWQLNGDTIAQGDGSTAEETYKYLYGIGAGTYTATIIHPDGCEVQEDIVVPDPVMIDSVFIQNECQSNGDDWIDLTVNPADSIIQNYLWNTGDITQDIYDLNAGTYSVIVSDTTCIDTLYFEIENIEFDDQITYQEDSVWINIPEQINIDIEFQQFAEMCFTSTNISLCSNNIFAPGDSIIWTINNQEVTQCETDFNTTPYPTYDVCFAQNTQIPSCSAGVFWFFNEGTYTLQATAISNLDTNCINEFDSVEITVTDTGLCNSINNDENQQTHIYVEANHNLIINLPTEGKKYTLEVFDMSGKKIINKNINSSTNLALEKYQSGIYNIRLFSTDFTYIEKVIIK